MNKVLIPLSTTNIIAMKTMKIFFGLLLVAANMGMVNAQSLFDNYAEKDEVTSVVISEKMFRLFANMQLVVDDQEAQDFIDIAKNVKGLRVLTTSDETIANQLKKDAFAYAKERKFIELLVIKDKGSSVYFYVEEGRGEGQIKELLMLVSELSEIKEISVNGRKFETVLLSLTGDLDMEKIGALANKMNLPEELGEINKAKRQ
jgi:hypothetical protein